MTETTADARDGFHEGSMAFQPVGCHLSEEVVKDAKVDEDLEQLMFGQCIDTQKNFMNRETQICMPMPFKLAKNRKLAHQ